MEKSIERFRLNKLNHTGKESGQKFTEQLEEELSLSLVRYVREKRDQNCS